MPGTRSRAGDRGGELRISVGGARPCAGCAARIRCSGRSECRPAGRRGGGSARLLTPAERHARVARVAALLQRGTRIAQIGHRLQRGLEHLPDSIALSIFACASARSSSVRSGRYRGGPIVDPRGSARWSARADAPIVPMSCFLLVSIFPVSANSVIHRGPPDTTGRLGTPRRQLTGFQNAKPILYGYTVIRPILSDALARRAQRTAVESGKRKGDGPPAPPHALRPGSGSAWPRAARCRHARQRVRRAARPLISSVASPRARTSAVRPRPSRVRRFPPCADRVPRGDSPAGASRVAPAPPAPSRPC